MCDKVTHQTLNAWLCYLVIYHKLHCMLQIDAIFDIHISQGTVATCLWHYGIFKHEFVANLLLSATVKSLKIS